MSLNAASASSVERAVADSRNWTLQSAVGITLPALTNRAQKLHF